jgi:hypothetical protein
LLGLTRADNYGELGMITWKEFGLGAAALLVPVVGYLFMGLENKVDEQSKQITKVSKQMDVVVSILSVNMPEVNLPALVSIAAQNETPPEKITAAIPLLAHDPIQAKVYLKSQMQFNDQEVNLIMQPRSPQKINTMQKTRLP